MEGNKHFVGGNFMGEITWFRCPNRFGPNFSKSGNSVFSILGPNLWGYKVEFILVVICIRFSTFCFPRHLYSILVSGVNLSPQRVTRFSVL